eukprot:scaffold26903_cov129-Isochrysis_galbana.AAC.9
MAQDPPGASSRARSARTHRVAYLLFGPCCAQRAGAGSSTFCHGRSGALRLRAIAHSGHTALKTVSITKIYFHAPIYIPDGRRAEEPSHVAASE